MATTIVIAYIEYQVSKGQDCMLIVAKLLLPAMGYGWTFVRVDSSIEFRFLKLTDMVARL